MRHVLIVADDFTGAADSAAGFAREGHATSVHLQIPNEFSPVTAVSTETRDLSVGPVRERMAHVGRQLARRSPRDCLLFKKVDSRFRGHPALELAFLIAEGGSSVLLAPAFPEQGRTTVDGIQRIDGVADDLPDRGDLLKIFAGHLPRHRVLRISVDDVRSDIGTLADQLQSRTPTLFVADSLTPRDLDHLALASLCAGIAHFCGTAGLSGALSRMLRSPGSLSAGSGRELRVDRGEDPRWANRHADRKRRVACALAVVGSRHEATRRQVEVCRRSGTTVVAVAPGNGLGPTVDRITRQLAGCSQAVLTVSAKPGLAPAEVDSFLAEVVVRLMMTASPAGVALTGGATATAWFDRVDVRHVMLCGEIEPGVPWGVCGPRHHQLTLATKSGGFGRDDCLQRMLDFLSQHMSPILQHRAL